MNLLQHPEIFDLNLDLPGNPNETRVVVAMSGGVDSSVVAALLKYKGYDVIGITLQLYDHGAALKKKGACCAGQDIYDARRVAEKIGIPHYVLDYENKFKQSVIDEFTESYLAGETPIPCVRCNQEVKFNDLLKTAKQLNAQALATGHYIKTGTNKSGKRVLYRAYDGNRDQSYFLFATTQEQIDYLRFPLGNISKDLTREIAEEFELPVASKPDSQDICFVPNGNYSDIIRNLRPEAIKPGNIVDTKGKILGQHNGIINFTIGQRRGLGVGIGEPLYVIKLIAEKAEVVVGPKESLLVNNIFLREVNWLGDDLEQKYSRNSMPILVKMRSTQEPVPAKINLIDDNWTIHLDKGEYGISPGQACVFYFNDNLEQRVLGGGWISKAIN